MDPFESESDPGEGETTVVVAPKRKTAAERERRRQPRYNVLLWDSDAHTFDYVEKMLRELFGHETEQCKVIAKDVDSEGRAIVLHIEPLLPSRLSLP